MRDFGLSRDLPVKKGATALLFVAVQNYSAEGGGEYAHLAAAEREARYAIDPPRRAVRLVRIHDLPAEQEVCLAGKLQLCPCAEENRSAVDDHHFARVNFRDEV